MLDELKDIITRYHEKTNGSCGITIVQINEKLNIDYSELQSMLTQLRNQGFIKVRKGINRNLIFKK